MSKKLVGTGKRTKLLPESAKSKGSFKSPTQPDSFTNPKGMGKGATRFVA